MGVYGNIHGAFNGLGKPSIKLEFEDNEALLDFQRRMQEGEAALVTVDPDLANFDQKRLDEAVANHNSIGWGMSDELRDGWTRVHSDAAPNGYDVMIKGTRPALRLGTYGWEFASSTDAQLVSKEKKLKATKGGELEGAATDEETRKMRLALELASNAENIKSKPYSNDLLREEFGLAEKGGVYPIKTPLGVVSLEKSRFYENGNHILKHVGNNFNVIKRTLEDPYLVFQSFDGKCHPNIVFLKSFRLDGMILISVVSPVDPTVFNVKTVYEPDINHIWNLYKKGGEIDLYRKSAKDKVNRDTLNANLSGDAGLSFKFVGLRLPMVITENGAKSFVDSEKKSLEGYGDFYTVRDMRKRSRKEPGDVATNKNLQFTKDATKTIKNFNHKFYLAAQAQQDKLGLFPNELEFDGKLYEKINIYDSKDGWYFNIDIFLPQKKNQNNIFKGYTENYAVYFDIDKCINIAPTDRGGTQAYITKDYYTGLYSSAILAYYNILVKRRTFYIERKYDTSEIDKQIKYYVLYYSNPAKYQALHMTGYAIGSAAYEAKKYAKQGLFDDLGKTANNTLYNNLDILDYRGMQPTYRQLPNYDTFFKPAANKNSLKGFGLADTKKLIADICRNHYKECAAIAKHLKAETKLQSAFNLWHWLHHNIRYEYDREGREEVRTPARVWQDRHRGVDCDCLSVFVWCVLKCMGYNPAFELAAFRNKPAYSHIYINLDGIVVDRVWYVFNSRPPFITKTELFKVGMLDNLGQLF